MRFYVMAEYAKRLLPKIMGKRKKKKMKEENNKKKK